MSGTCFECKFMRQRTDLEPCEHCTNIFAMTGVHPSFQPRKVITHYGRIISKTPEEMVKWIMSIEPAACPFREDHGDDCRFTHCEDCWLDWIRQEVSTDG